jgi:hypothetical protein
LLRTVCTGAMTKLGMHWKGVLCVQRGDDSG